MLNVLGAAVLTYLAGNGLATNAAVVGRGLVRSGRLAVAGNFKEAALQAAAAAAAPALMTYAATCALVLEVVDGAADLVGPVLAEGTAWVPERRAA
jgi:hypothetical protein